MSSGRLIKICPSTDELSSDVKRDIPCEVDGCSKVLPQMSAYRIHLAKSHKICNESASRPSAKELAKTVQKGDAVQYHCPAPKCVYHLNSLRYFSNYPRLRQHYLSVHAEKKFRCEKCLKKFGMEKTLRDHVKGCGIVHMCMTCGSPYTTRQAVLTHCSRNGHKPPDKPTELPKAQMTLEEHREMVKNMTLERLEIREKGASESGSGPSVDKLPGDASQDGSIANADENANNDDSQCIDSSDVAVQREEHTAVQCKDLPNSQQKDTTPTTQKKKIPAKDNTADSSVNTRPNSSSSFGKLLLPKSVAMLLPVEFKNAGVKAYAVPAQPASIICIPDTSQSEPVLFKRKGPRPLRCKPLTPGVDASTMPVASLPECVDSSTITDAFELSSGGTSSNSKAVAETQTTGDYILKQAMQSADIPIQRESRGSQVSPKAKLKRTHDSQQHSAETQTSTSPRIKRRRDKKDAQSLAVSGSVIPSQADSDTQCNFDSPRIKRRKERKGARSLALTEPVIPTQVDTDTQCNFDSSRKDSSMVRKDAESLGVVEAGIPTQADTDTQCNFDSLSAADGFDLLDMSHNQTQTVDLWDSLENNLAESISTQTLESFLGKPADTSLLPEFSTAACNTVNANKTTEQCIQTHDSFMQFLEEASTGDPLLSSTAVEKIERIKAAKKKVSTQTRPSHNKSTSVHKAPTTSKVSRFSNTDSQNNTVDFGVGTDPRMPNDQYEISLWNNEVLLSNKSTATVGSSDLGIGTSDFGVGTSDFGVGTSDFSVGTSDFGVGTSDFSFGTSDFGTGTSVTEVAVATMDLGIGTSDFSAGTNSFSVGTSDLGIETSDFGVGTTDLGFSSDISTNDLGIGTSDFSIGTNDLGVGTASLDVVTNDLGIGTSDFHVSTTGPVTSTGTGTTNLSIGTSDFSVGTSDFSVGTSDFSVRTSDFSVGTSDLSGRTTDLAIGTSDYNILTSDFGTSTTSVATSNLAIGTSDFRIGSSDLGLGTSDFGVGTSNFSIGTADLGIGTSDFYSGSTGLGLFSTDLRASASVGTSDCGRGTGSISVGTTTAGTSGRISNFGFGTTALGRTSNVETSNLGVGTSDFSVGTLNFRTGTADCGVGTGNIGTGTADLSTGTSDFGVGTDSLRSTGVSQTDLVSREVSSTFTQSTDISSQTDRNSTVTSLEMSSQPSNARTYESLFDKRIDTETGTQTIAELLDSTVSCSSTNFGFNKHSTSSETQTSEQRHQLSSSTMESQTVNDNSDVGSQTVIDDNVESQTVNNSNMESQTVGNSNDAENQSNDNNDVESQTLYSNNDMESQTMEDFLDSSTNMQTQTMDDMFDQLISNMETQTSSDDLLESLGLNTMETQTMSTYDSSNVETQTNIRSQSSVPLSVQTDMETQTLFPGCDLGQMDMETQTVFDDLQSLVFH